MVFLCPECCTLHLKAFPGKKRGMVPAKETWDHQHRAAQAPTGLILRDTHTRVPMPGSHCRDRSGGAQTQDPTSAPPWRSSRRGAPHGRALIFLTREGKTRP